MVYVSSAVDPKLDVGSWVLYCMHLQSLGSQDQNDSTITSTKSKFAIRKQFAWTSDREEFIAKKKNLLIPDYQSRPPVDNVGNTSTLKEP